MSLTIEELDAMEKATAAKQVDGEVVDSTEDEEEETLAINDVYDAAVLIRRASALCHFIADPKLCKTISKRERKVIARLGNDLVEFVTGLQENYEDI